MSENWTPTPELRFVERAYPTPSLGHSANFKIKVLQQKWVQFIYSDIPEIPEEWRDVPLVGEE